MEQSAPDMALTRPMLQGDLTDIDASMLHGDSTMRPEWWVQAAAVVGEAMA